jgi:hypothetical protein
MSASPTAIEPNTDASETTRPGPEDKLRIDPLSQQRGSGR